MQHQIVPYPPIPIETPRESLGNRILIKILPRLFRPAWKQEELFACNLKSYTDTSAREDIEISVLKNLTEVHPLDEEFMIKHVGRLVWAFWKRRLKAGHCCLMLARWQGQIVHYTFVSWSGAIMKRYAPVMLSHPALVGPCYTSVAARGQGVYPYVVLKALKWLKDAGYQWTYIHANSDNIPSLNGIRKISAWAHVGQFLLRRPAFGRNHIKAARICALNLTPFSVEEKSNSKASD